jgi:glycosyltransferase involved in cell wall biosynthesis
VVTVSAELIDGKMETMDDPEQNGIPASSRPRVSVIIPAYRAAPYISDALESVFGQTFQDFEVIVINDGSPDTPQLEAALQPYAGRLRYLKQPNRGVSAARNSGIRHSCGELLAFLDSDDLWLPQYLQAQVQFLDENTQAVAAIADVLRFGELVGKPTVHTTLKPGTKNLLTFEAMVRREGSQLPSATVVRRSKAIEAGLFDEQLRMGEDIEFCMRICFPHSAIGYTRQVLVKYRKHGAGVTSNLEARDVLKNEAECLRRVGGKLPLTLVQRSLLKQEIAALEAELAMMDAYQGLSNQEFDKAAASLVQANAYYRDKRIILAVQALKIFPHWAARILLSRSKRPRREKGNG